MSTLFAAADEFSDLLNKSSQYDELGVGSISNRDNADPKQLKWEMARDEYSRGKDWRMNKRRGGRRPDKKGSKDSKPKKVNPKGSVKKINTKIKSKSKNSKSGKNKSSKMKMKRRK